MDNRTNFTTWRVVFVRLLPQTDSSLHVCGKDGHLNSEQSETILGLMTRRLLVNCHIKQTGPNWPRFQLGAKWTQSGCYL